MVLTFGSVNEVFRDKAIEGTFMKWYHYNMVDAYKIVAFFLMTNWQKCVSENY